MPTFQLYLFGKKRDQFSGADVQRIQNMMGQVRLRVYTPLISPRTRACARACAPVRAHRPQIGLPVGRLGHISRCLCLCQCLSLSLSLSLPPSFSVVCLRSVFVYIICVKRFEESGTFAS